MPRRYCCCLLFIFRNFFSSSFLLRSLLALDARCARRPALSSYRQADLDAGRRRTPLSVALAAVAVDLRPHDSPIGSTGLAPRGRSGSETDSPMGSTGLAPRGRSGSQTDSPMGSTGLAPRGRSGSQTDSPMGSTGLTPRGRGGSQTDSTMGSTGLASRGRSGSPARTYRRLSLAGVDAKRSGAAAW